MCFSVFNATVVFLRVNSVLKHPTIAPAVTFRQESTAIPFDLTSLQITLYACFMRIK